MWRYGIKIHFRVEWFPLTSDQVAELLPLTAAESELYSQPQRPLCVANGTVTRGTQTLRQKPKTVHWMNRRGLGLCYISSYPTV